jgi:4-hydroxybenzoate polyprenyltransferase
LCLALSPIPLLVFVTYPHLKRFTPLCHFGVGTALALSPLGGYLGVTGTMRGLEEVLPLAAFTLLWVAGFDLIYATLDEQHDRAAGIHSLPAAIGSRAALQVSSWVQAAGFAILTAWTALHGGGAVAWACLAATGALLFWQQRAAARVELAFFRINSVLGFFVLALVWSVVGL